jgi:hypothetical protein
MQEETLFITDKPIIGFRFWRLKKGSPLLRSLTSLNGFDCIWFPNKPLKAASEFCPWCEYLPGKNPPCTGESENDEKHCGIYAFKDARIRYYTFLIPDRIAYGAVSLWGRIIVCENGYRAQYAYPLFLFLHPSSQDKEYVINRTKEVAGAYNIPVVSPEEAIKISEELSYPWMSKS